jgi:nitrogen fixation NifU-like protein
MDLYRQNILDHYKNPRNFGTLPGYTHCGESANASCGDKIKMEIILEGKGEEAVVKDVRFSGTGCAISLASASMLTEEIKGQKVTKVKKLTKDDLEKLLGTTLTPSRVRCATLPLEVLSLALA